MQNFVETGSTDQSATRIRCFFAPNEARWGASGRRFRVLLYRASPHIDLHGGDSVRACAPCSDSQARINIVVSLQSLHSQESYKVRICQFAVIWALSSMPILIPHVTIPPSLLEFVQSGRGVNHAWHHPIALSTNLQILFVVVVDTPQLG